MSRKLTLSEWQAEAKQRFGDDSMKWRFVCPACKHEQSVADYKAAGAPESSLAFSCVGRWVPGSRAAFGGEGPGPCNYAGGGLFRLNPVTVVTPDGEEHMMFEFAEGGGQVIHWCPLTQSEPGEGQTVHGGRLRGDEMEYIGLIYRTRNGWFSAHDDELIEHTPTHFRNHGPASYQSRVTE